jgi:hypothetical protein
MQYKINTYPDNIYAYISVFWLLDPYSQKSKHKIDADIYSTVHGYFTLYAFQFNLCFILVLGYLCLNIFKVFLEYFWNMF